jgi:type III secretion protein C
MRHSALLLLLTISFSQPVLAANVDPLLGKPSTTYQLEDEPLGSFLQDFLRDNGLRAVISPALKNETRLLNGTQSGPPNRIFSRILDSNALIAYVDGLSVYVYKAEEAKREFVMVAPQKTSLLKRSLNQMAIGDAENFTNIDSSTGVVEIVGSPRYVEQVRGLTEIVYDRQDNNAPKEMTLHHFPLKYAWAADRTFAVGTGQVTISGVASVLHQAMYGGQIKESGGTFGSSSVQSLRDSRNGGGRNRYGLSAAQQAVESAEGLSSASGYQDTSAVGRLPFPSQGPAIVASGQQNAIIVRDYPDRIPVYRNLIAALDTPSQIVEIEATIIDVNTDKLRNLGIEWRFSSDESNGEVMFAKEGTKQNFVDTLAGNSVTVLDQVPGFQIGAIIGDENQFIARINALEEEGIVKVASRPKVVTLNDLEAVIESSTSFYVSVESAYDAELFQVLTGTLLRVTPHLIEHDWGTQIRLIVGVEDGAIKESVEGLPVTTRNAVTTQALINTGHSLLLGGLIREEEKESEYKVPLLGDIPLIGYLFKGESKSNGQSERLFLISPRIVSPDGSDQPEARKLSLNKSTRQELSSNPDCKEDCQAERDDEHPLVF